MSCANCGGSVIESEQGSIVIHEAGLPITAICSGCTDGSLVAKILLRREPGKPFEYDQYSAIEVQQKSMSSARR